MYVPEPNRANVEASTRTGMIVGLLVWRRWAV
jgi:hypothetical protein